MSRSLTRQWLTITPVQGQNGATLSVHVDPNGGRNTRMKHIVATTSEGAQAEAIISQNGYGEHAELPESFYMQSSDQTITVRGFGNTKKITFSVVSGGNTQIHPDIHNVDAFMTVQSSYSVFVGEGTEIQASNGSNIPGDPGADEEYIFDVKLDYIVSHTTQYNVERCRLKAVADNGSVWYCDIIRQLGSFVTINGDTGVSIVFPADETTRAVQLESNDSWTITVDDNIPS